MRAGFHSNPGWFACDKWVKWSQSLVNEGRFPLKVKSISKGVYIESQSLVNEGRFPLIKNGVLKKVNGLSQSLVNEGRFPQIEVSARIKKNCSCRNPSLMRAGFHKGGGRDDFNF